MRYLPVSESDGKDTPKEQMEKKEGKEVKDRKQIPSVAEQEAMVQDIMDLIMQQNQQDENYQRYRGQYDGMKIPASVLFSYNEGRKTLLTDSELQKYYSVEHELPYTIHPGFNRTNTPWSNSGGLWFAALLIMGILIFAIRVTEKCLQNRLFQISRRITDEWPTATIVGTHRTANNDIGVTLRVDLPVPPEGQDLPPPYSDCTNAGTEPKCAEEPPPSYSNCFVVYSAAKDGDASVYIIDDQLHKTGTSESDDNAENSTRDLEDTPPNDIRIDISNIDDSNTTRQAIA